MLAYSCKRQDGLDTTYSHNLPSFVVRSMSRLSLPTACVTALPIMHFPLVMVLSARGCLLLQVSIPPLGPCKAFAVFEHCRNEALLLQFTTRCCQSSTRTRCIFNDMAHLYFNSQPAIVASAETTRQTLTWKNSGSFLLSRFDSPRMNRFGSMTLLRRKA